MERLDSEPIVPAIDVSITGISKWLSGGGKVRQSVLEGPQREDADVAPGVHAREGYTLVVTESPRESETERCSIEDFATRFGLKLKDQSVALAEVPIQHAGIGTELIDS